MITLKGNKKDRYVIMVKDDRYTDDIILTHEELIELSKLINKKI